MQPSDFKKGVRLHSTSSGKYYTVKSVTNNRTIVVVTLEEPGKVYNYKVPMHRAVMIFQLAAALDRQP